MEGIILKALSTRDKVSSEELAADNKVDHQEVVGAAKSLTAQGYIVADMETKPVWNISEEAKEIVEKGSPEYNLWKLLGDGDLPQSKVQEQFGKETTAVALANGMKSKLLKIDKSSGQPVLQRNAATASDEVRDLLQRIIGGGEANPKETEALKKRKLATLDNKKVFLYTKGPDYSVEVKAKAVGDLTREMLVTGAWKTTSFKEYNFSVPAEDIDGGQLHPLLKVRQEFREIFMELGFQEMDTQHWVESSFWNFDSLFIPQQHPARDLQDTFFISKPATSEVVQKELMAKVRAAHEAAFRTPWKEEEAKRNILRTHTTGSSAYTLFRLAQMSEKLPDGTLKFRPGRYYSIDRVFRNEEMDKTHLCEFHQIEGFVVGRNISLANMMHTFDKFFRRIGIERLRFKPTFNPYTEPSMEIFGFHTGLKKWIEVGNSGLFRPELLGPLGFDAGVSVMAWGISLERNTMIKYNISNIHELFGHRVNINFIKRSAIARF
ncbi:phenylalanyl-tRNA synthetase alpha chain [Angomonas deanei]|uniref:phenylalanine--tRNA ligase n=1 Tax=Angomonas deanei TaxID=59799 RepID=A0A7G2C9E5_9TRYP|nr:phenylalanyl-tRNA synthetase alpha chain [Angomonas deanei]CAD2216356.1 PheRS DNA binding domain 1/PheRS DNA binding domain 3/tRNA synthetases class II core domain (F), putative [Angomonas deanei]|eukprot:EPY32529.1 phenylalanyl-tRNA synthetase alpha chain [Angomonas deanei]